MTKPEYTTPFFSVVYLLNNSQNCLPKVNFSKMALRLSMKIEDLEVSKAKSFMKMDKKHKKN